MAKHGSVAVEITAHGFGRPKITGWEIHNLLPGERRREVVKGGVSDRRRHAARQVRPRRIHGDTGRYGDGKITSVEADRRRTALEVQEELKESNGEVSAGGVAANDDFGSTYGGVKGSRRWGEKGNIREKDVQEGGRKGMLRGKTVADGKTAATG